MNDEQIGDDDTADEWECYTEEPEERFELEDASCRWAETAEIEIRSIPSDIVEIIEAVEAEIGERPLATYLGQDVNFVQRPPRPLTSDRILNFCRHNYTNYEWLLNSPNFCQAAYDTIKERCNEAVKTALQQIGIEV
jgi:hypothetical protein